MQVQARTPTWLRVCMCVCDVRASECVCVCGRERAREREERILFGSPELSTSADVDASEDVDVGA